MYIDEFNMEHNSKYKTGDLLLADQRHIFICEVISHPKLGPVYSYYDLSYPNRILRQPTIYLDRVARMVKRGK